MAIELMGKFTAVHMRAKIVDPKALIINTCGENGSSGRGTRDSWVWSNPTNQAFSQALPADPTITAVSTECMWQGTKIFAVGSRPNEECLKGNWRIGKAKRPIGAWDGPGKPLLTSPGQARTNIYIPAFRRQIEGWLQDQTVARWVDEARDFPGNVYLRDHDAGRGIWTNRPMSHAWVLCVFLNTGEWPK